MIEASHSIKLLGITNPSSGGTGAIKLEIRRGDYNLLDNNPAFGQVQIFLINRLG
jgi:hypothetical protein